MTSLLKQFSDSAATVYEPDPLNNLCERLGIPADAPDTVRWMLVGMRLACDQPEFAKSRRGRPVKQGWNVDVERYALIELAAMRALPQRRTQTEWIALAQDGKLFADGSFAGRQGNLFGSGDLNASVSRGKKRLGGNNHSLFAKK